MLLGTKCFALCKRERCPFQAPNLESRELWKGFLYSVTDVTIHFFFPFSYMCFWLNLYLFNLTLFFLSWQLNVPSCLTLLPGQLQMLKEVVDKERSRRRSRTPNRAPPSPLSVPLVGEIPPWVCLQAQCQTSKPVQDWQKEIKLCWSFFASMMSTFTVWLQLELKNLCSFGPDIKITIEV